MKGAITLGVITRDQVYNNRVFVCFRILKQRFIKQILKEPDNVGGPAHGATKLVVVDFSTAENNSINL